MNEAVSKPPEPKTKRLVLLSAGGTGGHMFPAAALAQDLISRGYEVALATDERGKKFAHIFENVKIHELKAGTLRKGLMGKIKGMLALALGVLQARTLLSKLKPSIVVGFGGYPSVPAVYMAQRRHIPTIIHESNAVLGKANAFLASRADRIALSMPLVDGMDEADAVRTIFTGNPVRDEIAALFNKPYPALDMDGNLEIAVLGGSLGANIFSEVLPKAFAKLSPAYRRRLRLTQQCRAEDIEAVRKAYDEAGIEARLETFFDDMPAILSKTHLVISRSGASTVSEVTVAGRPAIFVPAPFHKDQQQKINADVVADAGGAWVMTQDGFTEEALLVRIETFLQAPETLFRAAENARSCAKPDAARRLGNLVTALSSGWDKQALRSYDITQGRRD
jgi:UDP-N-acetylglucosamine--N-acetylmuramyl-(pentapeptide) pyrophosphoryl-undecaprenol N-acetylglucosamine transferase